jgi:hypothetical protein
MKILIEGQYYPLDLLKEIFNETSYYDTHNGSGLINSVGYYYSLEKGIVVYMLPKVFLNGLELEKEGSNTKSNWVSVITIFKKGESNYLTLKELFDIDKLDISFKHSDKYRWIRRISVSFYKSLIEFKNRNQNTDILYESHSNLLKTNIGENEYTYIDLVLSFVNFYKRYRSIIFFHNIEQTSRKAQKPKWSKTIRSSTPFINRQGAPVYIDIKNKRKKVNLEEELLCYYFSILNHFNEENPSLLLKIDKSYSLIRGDSFIHLQRNGLAKLRKIKYRYFSDTLKRMYKLCELYFDRTDSGNSLNKKDEYISVRKYNIVFEDMVDKLFTDEKAIKTYDNKTKNGLSILDLKNNSDGKIIDHLFEFEGLIDTSNIFYIADSKYYKPGNKADKLSFYKQFTYAKNIVQFNINFFNENSQGKFLSDKIKYRDEITEGYNLTPNFLLYGFIEDHENFIDHKLSTLKDDKRNDIIKISSHWPYKLFDRDTLFVHQYKINFLFVLSAYTNDISHSLSSFKERTKKKFRNEFGAFITDQSRSKFSICEKNFETKEDLKYYVEQNFKYLNGKCYQPFNEDKKLLIALHSEDIHFKRFLISEGIFDKSGEPVNKFKFIISSEMN